MLDIPLWTPEVFNANEKECREILEDYKNWSKIPILNHTALHELKDNCLVRFRGMIQDMLQPEIYLEKYEVISDNSPARIENGKYRDCFPLGNHESVNFNSFSNVHGERRTLFVLSIPGVNKWVTDIEQQLNPHKGLQQKELPTTSSNVEKENEDEDLSSKIHKKRSLPDEQQDTLMDVDPTPASDDQNKRVKTESKSKSEKEDSKYTVLSSEYLVNSPIPERPSKACMIKIYSNFDKHPLNSIIDVVGFLSVNPSLDGSTEEPFDDDEETNEYQATNPPPSLIPRLHAICVKGLKHNNPLLNLNTNEINIPENFENIYKDLRIALTQCLFGDSFAAEYLLAHLISTIYGRTEIETLGQFCLNFSNIPPDVTSDYILRLYEIIESLIPTSHYFPMTLKNMNEMRFTPRKDYGTGKLRSGLLQLAPHTHLVVDETQLQPGKLEANGVQNVQSLARLIQTQQIKCDFKFYQLEFKTNIPVLILSEGKSMLPSNFHVPLVPDSDNVPIILETLKAAKHYLQPRLDTLRKYLTTARIHPFEMKPEDPEMIQKDFVEMRKSNPNVNAESLHCLLVLSRLMGAAQGRKVLDKDLWESAKNLETERRKRIETISKKT